MAFAQSNRTHNESTLRSLRTGDLIEFKRGVYSHWGVYLGREQVAHVTVTQEGRHVRSKHVCSISGVQFDKTEVRIDNFWDIVNDSKAYKNNGKDNERRPLDPKTIVQRAKSFLGKVSYNVFTSNCEHFAKWCRYEIFQSDQADDAISGFVIGGAIALLAGVIAVGVVQHRKKQ